MARPRWPVKRRERGRARDAKRARRGELDRERIVGALAGRGRGGLTAARLLRVLGADHHELRALRRMLRQLENDGRIERNAGGAWRVPRADGLLEAELVASGRVRDDAGREHRIDDV